MSLKEIKYLDEIWQIQSSPSNNFFFKTQDALKLVGIIGAENIFVKK